MIKQIVFVILLIFFIPLISLAQNQAPTITNVHFSQRTDGSYNVDIYYDLNDADGNSMTVSMKVSNDNGSSWTYNCPSLTGNIGIGQLSGNNKHIVWDFATDHPNTFDTHFKIKIVADDGVISGPGIPCPGLPSFTYDGQLYHTVQIGTQCWMKENLNVGTMVTSTNTGSNHSNCSNNGIIEKYCYNNDPANCAIYGGLYDWNEMMQYTTTLGVQGICPTNWHIPTDAEWTTLSTFLGGTSIAGGKMKETGTTHWYSPNTGATNVNGFTALGAGLRSFDGLFGHLTGYTNFWSSEGSGPDGIGRALYYGTSDIGMGTYYKTYGFSVRCVRNL